MLEENMLEKSLSLILNKVQELKTVFMIISIHLILCSCCRSYVNKWYFSVNRFWAVGQHCQHNEWNLCRDCNMVAARSGRGSRTLARSQDVTEKQLRSCLRTERFKLLSLSCTHLQLPSSSGTLCPNKMTSISCNHLARRLMLCWTGLGK